MESYKTHLGNPLHNKTPEGEKPSIVKAIRLAGGDALANTYEALDALEEGNNDSGPEEKPVSGSLLTAEEEANLAKSLAEERERRERSPEYRKEVFIAWAEKHEQDEDWVKNNFIFNPDGTVEAPGDLDLSFLTEPDIPEGIVRVGGYLNLSNLKSAEGLMLPKEVGGSLYLDSLTSAVGVEFPKGLQYLNLSSITSAVGVEFPEGLQYLNLISLESAVGVEFPEGLQSLDLRSLTSAVEVEFPEGLQYLYLNSITLAVGLDLSNFSGDIYLSSLPKTDKEALRTKYPHLAKKIH